MQWYTVTRKWHVKSDSAYGAIQKTKKPNDNKYYHVGATQLKVNPDTIFKTNGVKPYAEE